MILVRMKVMNMVMKMVYDVIWIIYLKVLSNIKSKEDVM